MSRRDDRSRLRAFRASTQRRWIAIGSAVALIVTGGVIVALPRPSEPLAEQLDCDTTQADTAEHAGAIATECDIDVEVLGERTPWERSYITSEGLGMLQTSTMANSTSVNGEWEDIDTTIDDDADDGMFEVEAPVYDMQLSAGGSAAEDKPLGVIVDGGSRLEVLFPMDLPTGEVDGNAVVYTLHDGVTLTATVNDDGTGFVPVVTLDSPAAAEWFETNLTAGRAERGLPGTGFDMPLHV